MNARLFSRCVMVGMLATSVMTTGLLQDAQAMPAKPLGLSESAPSLLADVRYRQRYYSRNNAGAAVALGLLGIAAGAAIAAQSRPDYYDDGYYGGPGYGYAPRYGRSYGYYGGPTYYGPRRGHYAQPRAYYDRRRYDGPRQYGPRYYGPNNGLSAQQRDQMQIERRPDGGGR
ncbi:MAG: hypothetical protein ABWZ80_00170 [Beijerinckiaceae bacterium]